MNHRLTPGRLYEIISIEEEMLRLVDDDGAPVLFEKEIFRLVDPIVSPDWVLIWGEHCDVCVGPPEFNRRGFWEYLFDGDGECIDAYLKRQDEFFGWNNRDDYDRLRYRRFFDDRRRRVTPGMPF